MNKHDLKGIKCQTGKDDRGKFEKTIINVALNVLYENTLYGNTLTLIH